MMGREPSFKEEGSNVLESFHTKLDTLQFK